MLHKNGVRFRKAVPSDMETLWRWRNDKETRRNSTNQNRVLWKDHQRWFQRSLKSRHREIYVAVLNKEKIGMVRFDYPLKKVVQVSINMDPRYRGKGFGRRLLQQSVAALSKRHPRKIMLAIIKSFNIPSEDIFSSAGFIKIYHIENGQYGIWIRPRSPR